MDTDGNRVYVEHSLLFTPLRDNPVVRSHMALIDWLVSFSGNGRVHTVSFLIDLLNNFPKKEIEGMADSLDKLCP